MAKSIDKTKPEKSHTEINAPHDSSKSLTWSIRDVDLETRMIIAKAAKLHSKTISQFMIDDVRAFAQSQITQTKLPATSQDRANQIDLAQILKELANFKSELKEDITQIKSDIENKKKPVWKRLFS